MPTDEPIAIHPLAAESEAARRGGCATLAAALADSRARTLGLLAAYAQALGADCAIPYSPQLNPPRWEAGHIGWFQDWWIARNRQRARGIACDPEHERPVGRLPGADERFNSSRVAHARRWELDLPDLAGTRDYLAASLAETQALLAGEDENDDALYFYRLSLFHEDMHGEAGLYMAQALGFAVPETLLRPAERIGGPAPLAVAGGRWALGRDAPGFAFDNELAAHPVVLAPYEIDAEVVSWARFLPWIEATGRPPPRYLRRAGEGWQRQVFGRWEDLPADAPATHLTFDEAQGWCRWAGRRLPTEAEWEMAALSEPAFRWGQVWEWTASPFAAFPGFAAHPYRDYSAPWFGDRPVLKGASRATHPRMVNPKYRNYFTAERNDIPNGFRSCALAP